RHHARGPGGGPRPVRRERVGLRDRGRRGSRCRRRSHRPRPGFGAGGRRGRRARDSRVVLVGGAAAALGGALPRIRGHGGDVRSAWRAAIGLPRPARGDPAVFYGHRRLPPPGEPVAGGMVKFQRLQTVFPNRAWGFNVLYLGSSSLPGDADELITL